MGNNAELIDIILSLDGVELLFCYLPMMTHSTLSVQARLDLGIKDNLVRFSAGVENREDFGSTLKIPWGFTSY